jgi:polyisoprenoid-binding protein YceI
MNKRQLFFALLALCWSWNPAQAAVWAMESPRSTLSFVARYEGDPAPGRFRNFNVRLRFDPRRPEQGHLEVSVDVASADMDSADINTVIRGTQWLDIARHKLAVFDSHDICPTHDGRYVAHGTLTLKGIARQVAVPFVWLDSGPSATLTGQLNLDRTAFTIGTGEWSSDSPIGIEVAVRFEIHLHQINEGAHNGQTS